MRRQKLEVPADFMEVAATKSWVELHEHYEASRVVVQRWIRESGVITKGKPRVLDVVREWLRKRGDLRRASIIGLASEYYETANPTLAQQRSMAYAKQTSLERRPPRKREMVDPVEKQRLARERRRAGLEPPRSLLDDAGPVFRKMPMDRRLVELVRAAPHMQWMSLPRMEMEEC